MAEVRAYPAGVIAGAGFSLVPSSLRETRLEIGVSAGYNQTRRRNWGEHDDERGSGPGAGIDVIFIPGGSSIGFLAGFRLDLWRLELDWRDDASSPSGPERTGQSRILILQPVARAGYRRRVGSRFMLGVHADLGAEINVLTDGEEVGQGAVLLLGFRVSF